MTSLVEMFENVKLSKSEACDIKSKHVDFNAPVWNHATIEKFLICYLEYITKEEESKDGITRDWCYSEEYYLCLPILRENIKDTWYKKLCECANCLDLYRKYNIEFLFFIKNIESLPVEMKSHILSHLSRSDRLFARWCSTSLMLIWDRPEFNDDRRLLLDKRLYEPSRLVLEQTQRKYTVLVLGEVDKEYVLELTTNHRETISTIEIKECFEDDLSFLAKNPNLKTLKVGSTSVLGDFSNVPTTLNLLDVTSTMDEELELSAMNKLRTNYLDKTSSSFRIKLNLPLSVTEILNFTDSQRYKIQMIGLHLCWDLGSNQFELPHFQNLKHLTLYLETCNVEKELELLGCNLNTEDEVFLKNLKKQLPALQDVSIQIQNRLPHKNWACFLKALEAHSVTQEEKCRLHNFEKLEKLTLLYNRDNCYFVHEPFRNKNLKELKIWNSTLFERTNTCDTCFQAMIKSYPELEYLAYNFKVTNEQLMELATNTPKLKFLLLKTLDSSVSCMPIQNLTELTLRNLSLNSNIVESWPLMLNLRKFEVHVCLFKESIEKIIQKLLALEELKLSWDKFDRRSKWSRLSTRTVEFTIKNKKYDYVSSSENNEVKSKLVRTSATFLDSKTVEKPKLIRLESSKPRKAKPRILFVTFDQRKYDSAWMERCANRFFKNTQKHVCWRGERDTYIGVSFVTMKLR